MGVLGFGRIGQATAKVALGAGMKVIYHDPYIENTEIVLDFYDGQKVNFKLKSTSKEDVLKTADFITLHVPAQKNT